MISVPVTTMRPHDDHAWRVVVARSDDDHGSGTVAVVVRACVAMVMRPAHHDLSSEVRVSKTQRHANARLSCRDAGGETKQESENDEDAFHWMPPWRRLTRERRVPLGGWGSKLLSGSQLRVLQEEAPLSDGGYSCPVQSPKLIPRSRAVAMLSESSRTRRGVVSASAIATGTIFGGCNATIIPNCRSATRRTAAAPKRSASIRSNVVGPPPRCRWPSTRERVSFPVISSIECATFSAIPPRRSCAGWINDTVPPFGAAPSPPNTILQFPP